MRRFLIFLSDIFLQDSGNRLLFKANAQMINFNIIAG